MGSINKTFTPRPYQDLIITHTHDILRSNVWAGMGMGKTVATLTALEDLFMAGCETQPALVLAPLRVARSTWPDEADKWDHLRNIEMQPIVGSAKERLAALKNSNASVYTINYDNLVWLVEHLGNRWPFGTVIADESTRLKNHRTKGGGQRAAALWRAPAAFHLGPARGAVAARRPDDPRRARRGAVARRDAARSSA